MERFVDACSGCLPLNESASRRTVAELRMQTWLIDQRGKCKKKRPRDARFLDACSSRALDGAAPAIAACSCGGRCLTTN
jgi:hypothetical protein